MKEKLKKTLLLLGIIYFFLGCSNQIKVNAIDDVALGEYFKFKTINNGVRIGTHILRMQDEELIIAGKDFKDSHASRGRLNFGNSVLVKLDARGEIIWKKEYDFLKYATIKDMVKAPNQDIVVVNPFGYNYSDYRLGKNKKASYLTRLNQSGDIVFQKTISSNRLYKLIARTNGDLITLGIDYLNPDKFHITCFEANGKVKWTKINDDRINWVDEMFIKGNILYINARYTVQDFSEKANPEVKRKIITFDLESKTYTANTEPISINNIYSAKENISVEFIKASKNTNDWILGVENIESKKITHITIGNIPNLIPRIQLSPSSICTSLNYSHNRINQITSNAKGELFITTIVLEDTDRENQGSPSIQAYCHKNVAGFIIIKLDEQQQLKWIKYSKEKAIPLNISTLAENQIGIIGTTYLKEDKETNTDNEQLFYLVIDNNDAIK